MRKMDESVRGLRLGSFRMQDQLLDAPIHDFSNVDFVFRGARDFVNPAKLLGLFARAAKDAKNLSIERYLVQAAGECVGGIQHLIWARRDADRPWCALMLASGCLSRRNRSHPRTRIGRERHVEFDLSQELAIRIEHLNPEVTTIR